MPPAHWGYLMSGVDGDVTLRANETAYTRAIQLRARRMVDVSKVDLGTDLFGMKVGSPILFSPIGSMRSMNPEGEVAVGRAAKTKNALQIVSTQSSFSVEQIAEARGAPVWFQLYTTNQFDVTKKLREARRRSRLPGGGRHRRHACRPKHRHRHQAPA